MDQQDSPPQEPANQKGKKPKGALTWVQDYLSRRSHSEKELLSKLLKKEFTEEESLEAIEFAKERKWLDSPQELSEKVYREWDLKNKSHQWISGYLEEKGLASGDRNSSREAQKAAYHLSKKFGKIDNDNYTRASSNIASKGFTYGDFKAAIEILKDET